MSFPLDNESICLDTDLLRVMIDARLSLELKECYIISFVFATEDVVAKWPPMYLPNLPILKEKVDKMETPDIGVNFAFRHNKKD